MTFVYVPFRITYAQEMVARAKASHKHGLITCSRCGFVWLTTETATADLDGEVMCATRGTVSAAVAIASGHPCLGGKWVDL